jgi:hypothetical protein
MIRPLRATHHAVFLFLPIVLAAVLASGLALRYRWPAPHPLLTTDVAASETTATVTGVSLKVRLLGPTAPTGRKVQLVPVAHVASPDLLVYWSEDSAAKALPPSARLVGSYRAGGIYTLPANGRGQGYLSLYSLAHREVVASIPVGGQP